MAIEYLNSKTWFSRDGHPVSEVNYAGVDGERTGTYTVSAQDNALLVRLTHYAFSFTFGGARYWSGGKIRGEFLPASHAESIYENAALSHGGYCLAALDDIRDDRFCPRTAALPPTGSRVGVGGNDKCQ